MRELVPYNGKRLYQFIESSELRAVNCLAICQGLYTRIFNNQRSAKDYVFFQRPLVATLFMLL